MAASNSLLNAALSSPKAPFLGRKNGRKKVGSEFHSRAFRPYVGDIFGTRGEYIDGMLYMSRMKRSYQITFGDSSSYGRTSATGAAWGMDLARTNEGRHALKDAVSDALFTASTAANGASSGASTTNKAFGTAALELSDAAHLAAVDDPGYDNLQAKQRRRCLLTLSNWSSNPENAVLMVQENVVEALILLCKPNDSVTRLHCVTALMNLSHIVELRKVIVRQGAVKTVAEIVDETEEKTLRTACAITLCNLCCLEGEEEVLVQDGAVSALSVLITEQPKVSWLCRTALFNLTCVREPYQKIESVLKMFITLTTSSGGVSTEDCDEITAKALCNLSNFKRIRLRLMEEGIVSAISSLIHMHASEIQEMLAYVMLNLSAVRACRSEMVAKGCMGTLISLTDATGAVAAKLLIASTLFNLSKEPGNRLRMVFEGLLLLVNELCRGPLGYAAGSEALRRVCANTLYNISCNEDTRVKLVERDAVSILSSLSKRTTDTNAKKMCTLALCNLLSVQQAAADIMNAGAITALIQLSMAPDQTLETKRVFSQALHGLCQQSETRDAVARAGVIQAIIYLSSVEAPSPGTAAVDAAPLTPEHSKLLREIRARCTAALACLAADERQTTQVCNVEVVLCVARILVLERSHIAIERFCCSCLSLLCRDEHCSQIMADEGAIQVVLSTCMETQDLETKASCCHVLASMSCHPSCCMALVRMGVISVLATLAKIKGDTGIQRCCAITLANLSAEPAIRDVLVTAGIVGILSMLSNSYSEESQRDCAKVLCNLSCVSGSEAHLVTEGAIGVLMMISMVRAVNATTKETCVRALFNLLNAETIKRMVQEGLVKVLPTFAALEMGNALDIVTMLFMKLVNHPVGRNALCTERSSLKSLFTLMEHSLATSRDNRSTFPLFESLLCELVHYENSRLPSVNAGIVDALHKLTIRTSTNSLLELSEDAESTSCTARRLALVLFTLSKYEETRMAAASSASIATLTTFLKRHPPRSNCSDGECVVFAVSTICSLAWHEITCSRLEHPEISSVLVQLLTTNSGFDGVLGGASDQKFQLGYHYPACAIKTTVLTLCCLSHNQEMLATLLNDRIIDCVYGILCQDSVQQRCDANAQLVKDREFLALVCILFRQLSHMSLFKSMITGQHSLVIPLFCTLTELVAGNDTESSLDCADALCSITFASVRSANISPAAANSSVTKSDRIPCAGLVAPNVMKAIASLAAENQLAETRWRSTASLWALSLVPEYRDRLVALGCTRLLVDESYRTETNAYLSILKCCAGALCNLTMPVASFSGGGDHIHSIAHTNAARMVDEGAVPALLQLSKLENTDIREHCTLALTNLSGQSPKVESGAVSALLNLSLQVTLPSSSHRPGTAHTGALSRPPIVNNARHKQFAKLPDFPMVIERHETLGECKYEADLVA
uniref:Armadillo repeat-containing domain-containing protein n=1 Tax=Globisporangium ultimum (strain ATCC 200006 / CBS 805.95 / DAOM BR144) TaxID=431595 RepID=K3X5K4_GLOUD